MLKNTILNIFADSPIKPMQHHVAKIYSSVAELLPFFQQSIAGNWDKAKQHGEQVYTLESEADDLKKDIRLHLPSNIFLPIARSDLLWLLTQQDKIANKAKHIVGLTLGRKMTIPAEIKEDFIKFLQRSLDATALAKKAINELDELVETGFGGREAKLVENMILELDQVERDNDNMQVHIRQMIFKIEQQLNPVDVIFLYKLIDWIAELADRAQYIGQRLESLLA